MERRVREDPRFSNLQFERQEENADFASARAFVQFKKQQIETEKFYDKVIFIFYENKCFLNILNACNCHKKRHPSPGMKSLWY